MASCFVCIKMARTSNSATCRSIAAEKRLLDMVKRVVGTNTEQTILIHSWDCSQVYHRLYHVALISTHPKRPVDTSQYPNVVANPAVNLFSNNNPKWIKMVYPPGISGINCAQ